MWQWEFAQWKKVGGKSPYAPGIVRNPETGRQHLVVVGSDGALWWSERSGDGQPWSAFAKAGGTFTTAPSVALAGTDLTDPTVVVSALGGNGKLYRADLDGSWTFAPVP